MITVGQLLAVLLRCEHDAPVMIGVPAIGATCEIERVMDPIFVVTGPTAGSRGVALTISSADLQALAKRLEAVTVAPGKIKHARGVLGERILRSLGERDKTGDELCRELGDLASPPVVFLMLAALHVDDLVDPREPRVHDHDAMSQVFGLKVPAASVDGAPRYQHDCDVCTWLGQFQAYDLYYCAQPLCRRFAIPQFGTPTLIARASARGDDYMTWSLAIDHPPPDGSALAAAYQLAQSRGLIARSENPRG